MSFNPELAEIRFGYGLSPRLPPVRSIDAMLQAMSSPDQGAIDFPIAGYDALAATTMVYNRFAKHARQNPETSEGERSREKANALRDETAFVNTKWFAATHLRRIHGQQNIRERLVAFWADHFTAQGKGSLLRFGTSGYIEDAVRPHVGGTFAELLSACLTHPLMLHYLDQEVSVGPNSSFAKRENAKGRGLNENLAREALELHTLGVGGGYGQSDVRELAELFTGMSRGSDQRFRFKEKLAEPGAETVLGKEYGPKAKMDSIFEVLQDLALHPDTAAHIARKLAVHFIADTPPDGVVAHMQAAYTKSGGDLMATYSAMLEHPLAWQVPAVNMRPPEEFISSAMRALDVPASAFASLDLKKTRQLFFTPLNLMGQPWQSPAGPDGWEEADAVWISPQGIAARLQWAFSTPKRLLDIMPDPREFAHHALGATVPKRVAFAASAAETRAEGVGLILTSPAFLRR